MSTWRLFLREGDQFRGHASNGTLTGIARPINRESAVGACFADMRMIHLPDLEQGAEQYPSVRQMGLKDGFLSGLYSPLLRGGQAIGVLVVLRREKEAFDDKDIGLLRTFTEQAVIAIENVRLCNETREALEQQTASAEVLQVIGSSVAATAPVFDKILDSCQHLFATEQLGIFQVGEAGMIDVAAWRGEALGVVARTFPKPIEQSASAQVLREKRILHIPDVGAAEDAPGGEKALTALSLLFASFLIKPTPLCILDEADSTLDESNTERFANMLRGLSGDIQFIIVT